MMRVFIDNNNDDYDDIFSDDVFLSKCPKGIRKLLEPLEEMLIKPLIKAEKDRARKESIKSLPSDERNLHIDHPAYFGTLDETNDSLENEGRLLMLPIMYKEWNIKQNKLIHDSNGKCMRSWILCECKFAEYIRREDLR